MALQYSPKIVQDSLVMCLDASNNKSYPTDLPVKNGLVMWMDAADDTTFSYSSGTTVSQWRDKSGFNYHMVPVSAGPTRNAFLNSRKVIACTTSQQIWNSSINLSTSVYTIFGVTRLTGTTNGRVLTTQYVGPAGGNWLLGHHGGTVNDYYAEGWVYDSATSADTTWRIFMGDWSGSSTDLANLYSNGTAIATNSSAASAGPIGLGINATNEPSTCEAAEIVVFNRVLSTAERRLVHTYLGQKWGISNTDRSIVDLAGGFTNPWLLGVGDGATNNMPTYSPYNKTFVFDGTNDIISYPNALGTFGSYTFSFWARRNVESKMALSSYGNSAFYWFGDNSWAYTHGGVFGEKYYNKAVSIPLGSYGHYCVTYDGAAVRIYRNGVFEDSQATTGAAVFNVGLQLGKLGSSVDYMFSGDIANFLMYTRALSAAEVQQNYESQKSRFANYIVTSGLVLNLDAGNPYSYAGAGTAWYDTSGNSFNATLINSPTYASDNGGVLNWASANSQYATVPMSSTLRVASITEEVWVYLSGTADQVFIGSQYGTSSNNSFAIWVQSGAFAFGVNTGGNFYYSTISTVSTGVWYHLTHTYNGTTQLFYINGVLAATFNSAASGNISYDTSNTLLAIGADFNGTGYNVGPSVYTNGKMPVVRIYNIALSDAQVLQNYNATKGRFGL